MFRSRATIFAALVALTSTPTGATPAPVPPPLKVDADTVFAHLAGKWELVSVTWYGEETTFPVGKRRVVTFAKDGSWEAEDGTPRGKTTFMDPMKSPREIDWEVRGADYTERRKMIFSVDADTFTVCWTSFGRPTGFKATRDNGWNASVFTRVK